MDQPGGLWGGAEAYVRAAAAEFAIPLGLYGLAAEQAGIALDIAREIGHREWTALALAGRGRVLRACGDAAGARRVHEEMLETARELGTSLWTADALGNLGEDLLQAGDDEAAARYLAEAIAKAGGGIKHALRPLIAQAELGLRAGRAEDALAAARRVAALAPEMRVFVAEARCIEGEALAMLGDAKAQAAAIGAAPPRWRSALALRRVLDRCGRHDEARREAAEARAVLECVSAQLPDPQLRRLFGHSDAWREANTDSPS